MKIEIKKNRNRKAPTFANINLLGQCNANCYFCLGKDICNELAGKNQLDVPWTQWKNFNEFLSECAKNGITKLYLTGQTADGLQYKSEHLRSLLIHLQHYGFTVGVRTNGYLAQEKMCLIDLMQDEIGYSIHSLNPETNKKIMGRSDIPDWDYIIPRSGDNVRVSIVLNRYNVVEFDELVKYISKFDNVKYIHVRRISTDTRQEELQQDIDLYESFYTEFIKTHKKIADFYSAEVFNIYGKEVNFWRTVETSVNSFNYFTDGTLSKEYFIVEGYLNAYKNNGVQI